MVLVLVLALRVHVFCAGAGLCERAAAAAGAGGAQHAAHRDPDPLGRRLPEERRRLAQRHVRLLECLGIDGLSADGCRLQLARPRRTASALRLHTHCGVCRYETATAFWDCAQQIERWAGPAYSAVLWFLVSDSTTMRQVRCCRLTGGY